MALFGVGGDKIFQLEILWIRTVYFFDAVMFNILNGASKCRKYGLEDDTIDFIGHALALHRDDGYLDQPAKDFMERVKV